MWTGRRSILAATVFASLAFSVACSGSGSTPAGVTPTASPPETSPTSEAGATPSLESPTTDEASPTASGPTPTQEVQPFIGETILFDYPANWYLWSKSYVDGKETVIVANVPQDGGEVGLPPGAIKMELLSMPAEPQEAIPGEVIDTFDIASVRFTLRKDEEAPWTLRGGFKIGGINLRYVANVLMNTPEPQTDVVMPILESWVIGSTGHHPPRSCITPGECP